MLTDPQLVKIFPSFYGTRIFITELNKRPPPVPALYHRIFHTGKTSEMLIHLCGEIATNAKKVELDCRRSRELIF